MDVNVDVVVDGKCRACTRETRRVAKVHPVPCVDSKDSGAVSPGQFCAQRSAQTRSISIPLNIAEGAGKVGGDDSARFYGIARGSAMEGGAILDACRVLKLIDEELAEEGKGLLVRIVSMLSKMCL